MGSLDPLPNTRATAPTPRAVTTSNRNVLVPVLVAFIVGVGVGWALFGRRSAGPSVASSATKPASQARSASTKKPDLREMVGWRGFQWGMSANDARTLIINERLTALPDFTNEQGELVLKAEPVTLDGAKAKLALRFVSDQLVSAALFFHDDAATVTEYTRLKDLLTAELGPSTPQNGTDVPGVPMTVRKEVWSFPRTTVTLNYFGSVERAGGNALLLTYEDPSKMPPSM